MSKKKLITIVLPLSLLILLCGFVIVAVIIWNIPSPYEAFRANDKPPPTAAVSTAVPRIKPTSVAAAPSTQTPHSTSEAPGTQPTMAEEAAGGGGSHTPLVEQSDTPAQRSTEQLLLLATLPERDQRLLAIRLKNQGQEIPETVQQTPAVRQLGESDTFWVTDNQQLPPQQFKVNARLQHITDHSYWWVQDGFSVNQEALERSAERFENNTYPTNRAFFGSEWLPGVDGDEHVHVFMGDVPGVAGYFSASNQYSKLAEMYSNEREMFFINLNAISPGNDYFDGVLAHEFQHMIHWYQDRNEDTWVNEGMSELATFLNGYGTSNFVGAFIATPDTQLTGWADTPSAATPHYGGSFLFMTYFLQRYGDTLTQAVVAHPENGIAGFNAALAEHGYSERFDDVFADFLIANYLQDSTVGSGRWGYREFSPGPAAISKFYRVYPQTETGTVFQFGTDYIELGGFGDVAIEFSGSTQVTVLDNQAHSGSFQWYSHRGDDSNTRLTRAFDLSRVDSARLNYWTWYDIEANWDYGYVEISTDGGQSWTILQTPHSATDNPSGNAYGPGYTGQSGQQEPGWLAESIDLSPYTGQEVLIRFEYVTDDAVNRSGWSIDDISIPEIEFFDDAESGPNGWQAEGFVRIDNILPQNFLVQILEIGDAVNVRPIPLDETNHGTVIVNGLGTTVDRAILMISGLTRVTSQPAQYEYRLTAN